MKRPLGILFLGLLAACFALALAADLRSAWAQEKDLVSTDPKRFKSPGPDDTARKPPSVDGAIGADEYPNRAVFGDGALTVLWSTDREFAWFALEARTEGWVSVGFGAEKAMKGADMAVGWVTPEGKAVIRDEYCTGEYGPHVPDGELGGKDDLIETAGSEKAGVTILEWKRRLDTGDRFDKPIPASGEMKILWALGASDDPRKSHAKRGQGTLASSGGGCPVETPRLWPIHAMLVDFAALLLFIGMAIARRKAKDRGWLARHQTLGLVAPVLAVMGAYVAWFMVSTASTEHFRVPHAWAGAAVVGLSCLVPALGFLQFRVARGKAGIRFAHVWLGRLTLAGFVLAGLSGLFAAGVL